MFEVTFYKQIRYSCTFTAAAYINKKGGMVCKYCNDLTFNIWIWAVKIDIWLSASHVQGVKNSIANLKSRYFYGNKEWPLNPYIFKQVFKTKIDPFAAHLNAKCESYGSSKPDSSCLCSR